MTTEAANAEREGPMSKPTPFDPPTAASQEIRDVMAILEAEYEHWKNDKLPGDDIKVVGHRSFDSSSGSRIGAMIALGNVASALRGYLQPWHKKKEEKAT